MAPGSKAARSPSSIQGEDGGWIAEYGSGPVAARSVLLATGVTNRRPPMDMALHDDAMARGLIRYCPICDGYEVTDKKVAVIGIGRAPRWPKRASCAATPPI